MKKQNKPSLVETDLKQLEHRVDELITTIERLTAENHSLQNQHKNIAGERTKLMEKHELVRGRVESMINRLKSLEHSA